MIELVDGRFELVTRIKRGNGIDTYAGIDHLQASDVIVKAIETTSMPTNVYLRLEHEARLLERVCPRLPTSSRRGCRAWAPSRPAAGGAQPRTREDVGPSDGSADHGGGGIRPRSGSRATSTVPLVAGDAPHRVGTSRDDMGASVDARPVAKTTFEVLPGRSAVLVKARSNVGPISFATSEVSGDIAAEVTGGAIDLSAPIDARLTVSLRGLTSGNSLYDTELKRRIDIRRYPEAILELERVTLLDESNQFELTGRITLHAVSRSLRGEVSVEGLERDMMVIRGHQTLDIREFDLDVPTTLALKIYPEVTIEMHIEARAR